MELSKLSDAADAAQAADEQAKVRKKLVLLGIVVILAVGIYFLFLRTPAPPSADSLATTALTAADPQARRIAALKLSGLPATAEVQTAMLGVVKASKDPEVMGCLLPVVISFAFDDLHPMLFEKLEDPDEKMRLAAAAALSKVYNTLPDGLVYDPKGPAEQRSKVRRALERRIADIAKK